MAGDDLEKKNKNNIKPLEMAFKISTIYLIISLISIYLSNKFLFHIYNKNLHSYMNIQVFRPYIFAIFAYIIILILIYKNLNKVKIYEDTIKSNLKEIEHKEIDLYEAECRVNNQKNLIEDIIKSASILILTLDEEFKINKVSGKLDLFTKLNEEQILGRKIYQLFESPIDLTNILNNNIKNTELKLLSNSDEDKDKYVLINIDSQSQKITSKIEYRAVIVDITKRKLLENQIHYLDYYDSLTDLPNRVLLEMKFKSLKDKTDFRKNSLALLYIDIDDFNHINEGISYTAGDQFLIYISKLLKDCITQEDLLARTTQDKFAIILNDIKSQEDIEKTIRKIYKKIKLPWSFKEKEYNYTVSIGISIAPYDGKDFDTLLKNAHLASEYLKTQDKGNYRYYSRKLESIVLNSLKLTTEIKNAILHDEFVLYYQTIIDLNTNKLLGVEALVRWIHPKRGMISPMEFIPIVEKTILTYDLMTIIVNKALKQKKQWNLNGINIPKISINVSSKSFSQKNFNLFIEQLIKENYLKNSEILLELTESGFTDNINAIESNIRYLRNIGIEIAMDDFGTGYSTLSRLKTIPIDYLKLDKSFIDKMTKNSEEEIMVKSVISLATTFGLKVLAEGIETKEQFELLKDMNCDFGQGYYMSKPVPPETLNENLKMEN